MFKSGFFLNDSALNLIFDVAQLGYILRNCFCHRICLLRLINSADIRKVYKKFIMFFFVCPLHKVLEIGPFFCFY